MELEGAFFNTDEYKKPKKKIGKGAFGEVVLVENKENSQLYAAKIINIGHMFTGKEQNQFIRESTILHSLKHPAIVKFYGINFHSFIDPASQKEIKLEPTLLTEYLSNGSLKEILENERHSIANENWNPTKKYICMLGICHAMRFLHKHGILHRDLKPENILLDDDYYPRVCDFGLSRCFSEVMTRSQLYNMTNGVGTPLYQAPELLDEDEDKMGFGIDVYAFAILLYEIVSGIEPFSENDKRITLAKLINKVTNGERPKFTKVITKKMRDLLNRCWSQEAKDRPTFDDIFNEISSDFSYFDEDVDEDEINDYLRILEEEEKEEVKEENPIKENKIEIQSDFMYKQLEKKIDDERNIYTKMIKEIIEKHGKIENVYDPYRGNILHLACSSGNLELVKYIISLNKIDITSKTIIKYS